jgi:hypothetical protein
VSPSPEAASPTARRTLAWALVGLAVLAVAVVALGWPAPSNRTVLADLEVDDAAAGAVVVLEQADPNRGTVELSLQLQAGLQMPEAGVTLFTDVAGLGPIHLLPTVAQPTASAEASTLLDGGDLVSYPFDRYPLTVSMLLVEGDLTTDEGLAAAEQAAAEADGDTATGLPLAVVAASTMGILDASVDAEVVDGAVSLDFEITRPGPSIVWAVAMMAIFWLLGASAVGVALAVLLRVRPFETRHLAWLTALLFAFAAFRNTAPGDPPIGVFLDQASFFWAVALVVVAELLLLGCYLRGRRPIA